MNILNIEEFNVLKQEENEFDYRFTVEVKEEPDFCPNCLKNGKFIKHSIKEREVWDLDMHSKRVKIVIRQRRYKCPYCGATFYELLNSVATNAKITTRLYKKLQDAGLQHPFTQVAGTYGVSHMTVKRSVQDYIDKMDKLREVKAPRVIGIDEAHLNKTFRGVITDIQNRQLIELLPINTKKEVKKFISSLPGYKDIEVATMDMAPAYKYAMNELVPNALCIVDKYHVIQASNRAFNKIRTELKGSISKEQKNLLLRDRWVLLTNKESLDEKAKAMRDRWFSQFPILATAYWIKEGLRDIYNAVDRYEAFQMYYAWECSIPQDMKEYQAVRNMINGCKQEVFNYFLTETKYTNAYTESINNQIKRIEKIGNGYSYEVLRAKILYKSALEDKPKYGSQGFTEI
jgi:transposase